MESFKIYKVTEEQKDPTYNYNGVESYTCTTSMFLDKDAAMEYAYELAAIYTAQYRLLPVTNPEKEKKQKGSDDKEYDEEDDDEEDDDDDDLPYFNYYKPNPKNISEELKPHLSVSNLYVWERYEDYNSWSYKVEVKEDEINLKNKIINKTYVSSY